MTTTISGPRSHAPADVARSLEKLGIKPESLGSRENAVSALDQAAGAGNAQAKALREALSSFSREDLKAVREALGQTGGVAAPDVATRSGVGGAGVPRFAVEARLPKVEGNTPEVAALLKKYEPHGPDKVGRPLERILDIVAKVDGMVCGGSDAKAVADALVQHDARRTIFLLEGQMRLYKNALGDTAEKGLAKVKELEDQLGAVSLYSGLAKVAVEKGAAQEVVDHLRGKEGEARAALVTLVQADWMPDPEKRGQVPALNKLVKNLCSETLGRHAEDKDYLCGRVRNALKKLEAEPYDWNDLQGGIHEFRRDLRWIPVYVEASGGLMQLSDKQNPLPALQGLLQDPLATSKFVNLPPADREPGTVQLSKSLYIAVMKAVLDLGAIKDQGEREEFLVKAYVDSGAAPTAEAAHAAVKKLLADDVKLPNIHATAEKVHGELVNGGVLRALRDELQG
jgi:hypothetical protein